MAFAPQWKVHARQQFVLAQRGRHESRRELRKRDLAGAARSLRRQHRIHGRGDGDELGRGIELAERAAERAAVTRLPMADLQHRLVHKRTALLDALVEFHIALARHCADDERVALLLYISEIGDAVQIDDVIGRGEPHIEHRHERLAAGEKPRVLELAEQSNHLGHGLRVVVVEARRLHSGRMPAWAITSRKRATSALMITAISGADFANMSIPAVLMRAANSGVPITLRRSLCSLATMSGGVPARAIRP